MTRRSAVFVNRVFDYRPKEILGHLRKKATSVNRSRITFFAYLTQFLRIVCTEHVCTDALTRARVARYDAIRHERAACMAQVSDSSDLRHMYDAPRVRPTQPMYLANIENATFHYFLTGFARDTLGLLSLSRPARRESGKSPLLLFAKAFPRADPRHASLT